MVGVENKSIVKRVTIRRNTESFPPDESLPILEMFASSSQEGLVHSNEKSYEEPQDQINSADKSLLPLP